MENVQFKLAKENIRFNIYSNGYYEVAIDRSSNDIAVVRPIEGEYLPNIYVKYSIVRDFEFDGIEIQTTSYGAMSKEKIEEIVKGYNIALATVQEIEKYFIK